MNNEPTDLTAFNVVDYLDNNEAISEYLSQVMDDGDTEEIIRALGYVARARGMKNLSDKTGLGCQSLYKSLRPGAKPRYDTLLKILHGLGIRLHATAATG